MKKLLILLIAFVALFLGCSEDTLLNDLAKSADEDALQTEMTQSDSKTNNGKAVTRPFKLEGSGTIAFVAPTQCPDLVQLLAEGTGNATHLGKFSVELNICSNFDFENPENLIYEINGTQIAANGDKLFFYSSYANGDINFNTGSTLYHYYKGTGRFLDVEGEITLFGVSDLENGVYSNYGEGRIKY